MTISQLQVQEFMNFFSGSKHAYGELVYGNKDEKGKVTGKYRTVTNKLVTLKEYKDHLEGTKGLGIIPINEESQCSFSVIDIDIYGVNLNLYIKAIERGNFPLVPFRSKSGGLHLYLFLSKPVKVRKVVDVMRKFSLLLSVDSLVRTKKNETVEIFPKQLKVRPGETGSWINLPYYNHTESNQYAIKEDRSLSLNEALVTIKEKQRSLIEVEEFLQDLSFNDAPPCLQMLYFLNPFESESGRNNFLFSFGVYLKKKDEDFFEQNLQEINAQLYEPLSDVEIEKTILSSLRKKDYIYRCKESPCVDFCNKKECKNREYGIGKNEGYFSSVELGTLYQYKTSQPYYEWEVKLQGQDDFKRLRFKSEDEIIKQDAFLRLCMRELHELPSKLKQLEWFNKVNQALKEIKCVDVERDDDTSPFMLLRAFIIEFITGRAMAETKDQILAKRVYFSPTTKEYLFRVKDLTEYVYVTKGFRHFSPGELHGILRELNCTFKKITTESRKQVRIACFAQKDLDVYESKEMFTPDFSKYSEEDF